MSHRYKETLNDDRKADVSIVTPAFNEALNLETLYHEICRALDGEDWEWLVIDDHSTDGTYQAAVDLGDSRVQCLRLSRNFGSHAAAASGFHHARGSCAVLMAADLQDPPDVVPQLLDAWRRDADVVWAVRGAREGLSLTQKATSTIYHSLLGRVSSLSLLPSQGADFVLVDRKVLDALKEVRERNASVLGLIAWLGFRHSYVSYVKRARAHGISGWTFRRRMKLALDSFIAFSYLPMRLIMWFGVTVAFIGLIYSAFVFAGGLRGNPVPGWSSTIITVTVLGGVQMIMIGIIGQYIWRILDEVRARPLYVIEKSTMSRHKTTEE